MTYEQLNFFNMQTHSKLARFTSDDRNENLPGNKVHLNSQNLLLRDLNFQSTNFKDREQTIQYASDTKRVY